MPSFTSRLVFCSCLLAGLVVCAPSQAPISMHRTNPRKLHGRFLHLTDIHIDPHYIEGTSQSKACHRQKASNEKEPLSGYYGTPFSDCDSSTRLSNFTFDFLDEHWGSEIDFVIWTGDTARHDNDRMIPRTWQEVSDLNRAAADRMYENFASRGIPVVPSLGNNDVSPHNIMTAGPNEITNDFLSIWKAFIPSQYYKAFQRGAYFSVEVIPNAVAVISLNTLYFFDSNKAIGGCTPSDGDDPGNLEFDWLEVQLKSFKSRNMQVWISGHVPPTPGNYFAECLARYTALSLRFQDTILGHLYGHMNNDHFYFLNADEPLLSKGQSKTLSDDLKLFKSLLSDFAELGEEVDEDEYAVVNVSPSVVPTYAPSFRIFVYNMTEAGQHPAGRPTRSVESKLRQTDSQSPSRHNTLWSPIGYAQYYMPNLESANETNAPKYRLEYLTLPPGSLHPPPSASADDEFVYPLPLANLPRSLRNLPIRTRKYTPYHLTDLTIGSWIGLAKRLARDDEKTLRRQFKRYLAVRGG